MTTTISNVLERGDRLDQMSLVSGNLAVDSRKYLQSTRRLNLQALYRKYLPLVVLFTLVLLFLYIYIKWA